MFCNNCKWKGTFKSCIQSFLERVKLFLLPNISSVDLSKRSGIFNPSLFLILNLFLISIVNNCKFIRKFYEQLKYFLCYRVVEEGFLFAEYYHQQLLSQCDSNHSVYRREASFCFKEAFFS